MVVDERNKTLFVSVYQMPVMLIRIHEIIIVIYMKCLGYHIRNQQTKKIESGTFAVCKNQGTRQMNHSLPCAKASAHGKGSVFAVCHIGRAHGKPTSTSPLLEAIFFAVERDLHTAKGLPCARYVAHGKDRLCRRLNAVCRLPCAAHGKSFTVCISAFAVCFGTRQTDGFL